MLKQRTLRNPIKALGIGLHTGKNISMELLPSKVNTGINFIRTDIDESFLIPAIAENVGDTSLSTALIKDDIKISTIEHLLSAIAGLGVDNCIIKVDGPEVPIMDGSSSPFVFLIQSAGLEEQDALKKFIKVKKEIAVSRDDAPEASPGKVAFFSALAWNNVDSRVRLASCCLLAAAVLPCGTFRAAGLSCRCRTGSVVFSPTSPLRLTSAELAVPLGGRGGCSAILAP